MKNLFSTPMHPKAPLIVGIAIILFTLIGIYAMPIFLWLDVLAGGALVYLGVTGNCMLSGLMSTCYAKKSVADSVELP